MGCSSSTSVAVHPLAEANQDEVRSDEAGSKSSGRGNSARSKGTTDSGVMMENRDHPVLPGGLPEKIPPVPSGSLRECVAPNNVESDSLQGDATVQGRPKSMEILEELWSQGIIPVGQMREKDSGAAYCIMDESKRVARRLPSRLESLKAKKVQSHSREEFDEKMRLVEERRKMKQEEMKTRLRTNTSQGRRPAPAEEEADSTSSPVESLRLPAASAEPPASAPHGQAPRKAAVGGEWVKGAEGDSKEWPEGKQQGEKTREDMGEEGDHLERGGMEEEELTVVEELRPGELQDSLEELESDSSFQRAEDKDETF
ncbi:stathmin domain-containing protein 1 [Poeciliopsis prolifica]|uniref:stathmin domain-containing protein 1 n=1 Tax=Poeciliopsis prolifica TaxID=188132 RepID=UPI0024135B79|nr:stathmin domain-containing protein 1 [Poeciliopsis prolifica]